MTITERTFKGSSKGLRCYKPREEDCTQDSDGWHQCRTGGEAWGDFDGEEGDEFYANNEEKEADDEQQEDHRELERQSYLARREQEQNKEREARLKLKKEEVLNALEKAEQKQPQDAKDNSSAAAAGTDGEGPPTSRRQGSLFGRDKKIEPTKVERGAPEDPRATSTSNQDKPVDSKEVREETQDEEGNAGGKQRQGIAADDGARLHTTDVPMAEAAAAGASPVH